MLLSFLLVGIVGVATSYAGLPMPEVCDTPPDDDSGGDGSVSVVMGSWAFSRRRKTV